MEKILQVQKRHIILLASVSSELNIKEGDYISLEVKNGAIIIRPVAWHVKKQAYFWTEKWQNGMKKAMDDIEKGRYEVFDSLSDLTKRLEDEISNEI
jgi:antitoxin component of MazEF toxin-antitoxin module